mgnify:CR=1 FL=1
MNRYSHNDYSPEYFISSYLFRGNSIKSYKILWPLIKNDHVSIILVVTTADSIFENELLIFNTQYKSSIIVRHISIYKGNIKFLCRRRIVVK